MPEDHRTFVTITKLGSGWTAVQMWWAPEHGGFWEPWQTGVGRYATAAEAEQEGRSWAEAEDQKFHLPETV